MLRIKMNAHKGKFAQTAIIRRLISAASGMSENSSLYTQYLEIAASYALEYNCVSEFNYWVTDLMLNLHEGDEYDQSQLELIAFKDAVNAKEAQMLKAKGK